MSESFQYGDIIFLGLIALFIVLRLRSMLGRDDGTDKKEVWKNATRLMPEDKVMQFPLNPAIRKPVPEEISTETDPVVAQGLKAIREADASFSTTDFIHGAKIAFEWVVDAFARSDKDKLRMVLSEERFAHFAEEIDRRASDEHKYQSTLVAVISADITEAELAGTTARITIQFTTEQVNIVRDRDNTLISGNPNEIERLLDIWTFERDTRSRDPNWKITAT